MSHSLSTIQDDPAAPRPWGPYVAAMAIAAAVGLVYSNSFHGPFVFDDLPTIIQNETVHHLQPLSKVLSPPAATTTGGRPLVNLTLAVNYALSGMDVVSYHAINLIIHLLAALTLFGVVRRTLLVCRHELAARSTPLAAAIALIWAVHPLDTESVTYITQRAESIFSLFYLLTLYGAIRGATGKHSSCWHTFSVLACLAGMASKEAMVSAPLVTLIHDRIFLAGSFREIRLRRSRYYLALFSTWLLLGWLVYATGTRSQSAGFGLKIGVIPYAETQLVAIPLYLRLSFWPHPLVFDYGAQVVTAPAEVVPGAISVVVLIAATLVAWWFWPRLGFLGVCFFALLAPSSSIIPIATQTMAEHRMYLALAAVVAWFVLAGDYLLERAFARLSPTWAQRRSRLEAMLAAVIVVAFGFLTLQRNHDYRSGLSLWQDNVNKRPNVGRVHAALAAALLQSGNAADAIREATRSIELNAEAGAYLNRGLAELVLGRHEEALADFNRAIELEPNYPPSYYNRGSALTHMNRHKEAIADFDRAIELSPGFGTAYLQRGAAKSYLGRYEEAIQDFNRTIELEPRAGDAYYNRAQCRMALKQYDLAHRDAMIARELGEKVDSEFFEKLAIAARERAPAEE